MRLSNILPHIKNSLRRNIIRSCLKALLPEFANNSGCFRNLLQQNGFHFSVVQYPSCLLIPNVQLKEKKSKFPNFYLKRLRYYIQLRPFCAEKDIFMLESLGIVSYFSQDISRILAIPNMSPIFYQIPERDVSTESVAVYTALTGEYDNVHELLYREKNVDYFLFTNNPRIKSTTWNVVLVASDLDDVLLSRELKMCPFKYLSSSYTATIYVDANATIYGNIASMSAYLDPSTTMAVTKHHKRTTVRDEIIACVETKGINKDLAMKQYNRYVNEGFVDNMGLAECTILIRRQNNPELDALMLEWFREFKNGVKRDQLSLLPCVHRTKFSSFKIIEGNVWFNQFALIGGHK